MTVQNLLLLKGYLLTSWIVLLFVAERLWPTTRVTGWPASKVAFQRLARNVGLWLVNIGVSPLVVLPISFWAAQHQLDWRPEWWQGGPGLLLDLLLLDLWIYWWHRANHRLPLLWCFHRIHHLDQQLDVTTAIRFHFGEVLLSALLRGAVVVLLGVPFESVLVFEILVMMASVFHHSDIRLAPIVERVLSKLVVTPGIHWLHHHATRADTNSNYATVVSVWDRLFQSRSNGNRSVTMPIGVVAETERSFWRLLIEPFSPNKINPSVQVGLKMSNGENHDGS